MIGLTLTLKSGIMVPSLPSAPAPSIDAGPERPSGGGPSRFRGLRRLLVERIGQEILERHHDQDQEHQEGEGLEPVARGRLGVLELAGVLGEDVAVLAEDRVEVLLLQRLELALATGRIEAE